MADAHPVLAQLLADVTDMPALPAVVARLTRLLADPDATAANVNTALSADPGLVAKLLKIVNSPYYGFSRRITSITSAIVILGFNQVRNIALSTAVFDLFKRPGCDSPGIDALWRHSVGTAFAAAQIAKSLDPKLAEDAFICGLLHDLGKFVMAQNAPASIRSVANLANSDDILFRDAETRILPYDHALLGAAVMERWNLPLPLVEVVRWHHAPEAAPDFAVLLACVTNLADITARALLIGSGGDKQIPRLSPEVWQKTGMDWPGFEDIIRRVADEYSSSAEFFAM